MTTERPMFPPRAESVDSFSYRPGIGQPETEKLTSDSPNRISGLYYPTPVTPEEAFQAIGQLRKDARDEIDRLLRFLDETDDHMEREPDLGWPENHPTPYGHGPTRTSEGNQVNRGVSTSDREVDGDELDASYPEGGNASRVLAHPNEDDEDDGTAEPSLGSVEGSPFARRGKEGQESWATGNRDEREGDGCSDDREPDVDDEEGGEKEPSFGWNDEEAACGRYPSLMMGDDREHGEI